MCTCPPWKFHLSFEELAVPLFDQFYNFAYWLTRDRNEAEDLVQEAGQGFARSFVVPEGSQLRVKGLYPKSGGTCSRRLNCTIMASHGCVGYAQSAESPRLARLCGGVQVLLHATDARGEAFAFGFQSGNRSQPSLAMNEWASGNVECLSLLSHNDLQIGRYSGGTFRMFRT